MVAFRFLRSQMQLKQGTAAISMIQMIPSMIPTIIMVPLTTEIANCASSRFALRTLRAHGLPPPELYLVTRMTSVSSLMYASPSRWGFTDASDRSRLERQLASLRRAGFLPFDFPSFDELARNADAGLFRSICSNPDHVLRHCFIDKRPTGHNLCPRAHSFVLPSKDPQNFVSRTLYGALLKRD